MDFMKSTLLQSKLVGLCVLFLRLAMSSQVPENEEFLLAARLFLAKKLMQ